MQPPRTIGSRVVLVVFLGTAGLLIWAATYGNGSPSEPSKTAAPVIQTEIVFTIVTETPTTGPMATTRPTAPPYQTSVPTWTPTTFPMTGDQSGEVRVR